MDLSHLRKKIDGLDAKIIELLNDRAAITLSIGQEKIKNKKPIYAPDREQDVLKRIKNLNAGLLKMRRWKRFTARSCQRPWPWRNLCALRIWGRRRLFRIWHL